MISTALLRSTTFAVITALATLSLTTSPAHAAAPMVKTSAPGYYRVMLGDFEVTALSDGTLQLPMDKALTNINPADFNTALKKFHITNPIETSFNGYLINTGSKLVLIDTGAGKFFGATLGKLAASLKAAGYQPEQVDEIYITHMHGDHIGGLTVDGVAAFPNAIVRADKHEADYWLSQAQLDKAAADDKGGFQHAMEAFQPYIKAGKFKPFDGNTDLTPGIKAVAAYGHTPGHTTYLVESKGQKLMLWGDLMHVAAAQFDKPSVAINFDHDNKAAIAERKKAYADAAQQGYMVGSAHLSFPGLGYLRAEGKGYAWIPVNYVSLP
ncbi:MBL fold metallo-hydrolase [Solimicrobium silvestre]|uniref:MBL fold metallo-hydrolase n=1 Tax=Solimicrobium silvestre TaxID=2099400 RepID=UPI003C6F802C